MRQLIASLVVTLAIVVPLWILWRAALLRRSRAAGERFPLRREASYLAAVVYAAAVFALTVPPQAARGLPSVAPNLVPFRSIVHCILQTIGEPKDLLTHCTADFVGNMLLLFPFGLLAPLLSSRLATARAVLIWAAVVSAGIELVQFLESVAGGARTPDVDDVILNVAGACAGYLAFRLFRGQTIRSTNSENSLTV